MKSNITTPLFFFILMLALVVSANAQRKPRLGKVCGDPTAACSKKEGFEPNNLPFDEGKNYTIAESEWFYGIVLKSAKIKNWGDCDKPSFTEKERVELQSLFPKNKVFSFNCLSGAGDEYYNGVSDQVAFIAVYAGRTLAEANEFLKTVVATNKLAGVKVRRMQAGINGT